MQRVVDGVHDRGHGAGGAGLAHALDAERVARGRDLVGGEREIAEIVGPRHRVVHEGAAQQLAVRVVVDVLHQDLPGALGDAAMHLAVEQQRVEHHPGIVDAVVAHQPDAPGLAVDLDFGKMEPVRIDRPVIAAEIAALVEPGLDVVGQFRLLERVPRDVCERDRSVGADHAEPSLGVFDIDRGHLQHMAGDPLALVYDLVGGFDDRGAGQRRAAGVEGADPGGYRVGIAVAVADIVHVDAEPVGQHLAEGRPVGLAVIHRAAEEGDAAA